VAVNPHTHLARKPPTAREGLRAALAGGGTAGNERLTAAADAALIPLLAVIGVTIHGEH